VSVSGQPVVTSADLTAIVGCAFNVASAPHPCVKVQWVAPSAKVWVEGAPALLLTSQGQCQAADLATQGPALLTAAQPKAIGT
jgi:hypothetical protein